MLRMTQEMFGTGTGGRAQHAWLRQMMFEHQERALGKFTRSVDQTYLDDSRLAQVAYGLLEVKKNQPHHHESLKAFSLFILDNAINYIDLYRLARATMEYSKINEQFYSLYRLACSEQDELILLRDQIEVFRLETKNSDQAGKQQDKINPSLHRSMEATMWMSLAHALQAKKIAKDYLKDKTLERIKNLSALSVNKVAHTEAAQSHINSTLKLATATRMKSNYTQALAFIKLLQKKERLCFKNGDLRELFITEISLVKAKNYHHYFVIINNTFMCDPAEFSVTYKTKFKEALASIDARINPGLSTLGVDRFFQLSHRPYGQLFEIQPDTHALQFEEISNQQKGIQSKL